MNRFLAGLLSLSLLAPLTLARAETSVTVETTVTTNGNTATTATKDEVRMVEAQDAAGH